MTALILWIHVLAALAFALAAGEMIRRRLRSGPAAMLCVALVASGLWALAVAGIGPQDVTTRLMQSVSDLAWLAAMFAFVRRDRVAGLAPAAIYAIVALVAIAGAVLAVAETAAIDPGALAAIWSTELLFRMMTALSALVLLHHLRAAAAPPSRGAVRLAVTALALHWGIDLAATTISYLAAATPVLDALRGAAAIGVALLIGIAVGRDGDRELALSRRATLQTLSAAGLAVWLLLTIAATSLVAAVDGPHVRLVQTAIVAGATVALLTLLSSPWLRSWLRVKVAKHLFSHRYDYREAWATFTATLGETGTGALPLADRVARAMAGLIEAPAALVLVADGEALSVAGAWRWTGATGGDTAALARHLSATGRIVALDAVRAGAAADAPAAASRWLVEDTAAWGIAPLFHHDRLAGAVVLGRPPDGRVPDWEDFDMLRVAGRQAASHLAELAAADALAEARRFDEFNRRFAFIMHDLKNMVSQLTLVARNAERHAANPDFRADMAATLNESAERMTGLIARLGQRGPAAAEPSIPTDLAAVAERIAARRRPQHPIEVAVSSPSRPVLAQPARLEQAIEHLVQNAIEASAAGSPVMLSVAGTGERAMIEIVDRGRGMSPGFVRDELFRPFASAKPGGFGLGAHEARALVEAMGGTLSVDSREGHGTRFTLALPAAAAWEAAA